MNLVHARQHVTVKQLREQLSDPPTPMAVRRMLAILTEKGYLRRRQQGREVVYSPRQSQQRVGLAELRKVLQTFFAGSLSSALALYLERPEAELSDAEVRQLKALIHDFDSQRGES